MKYQIEGFCPSMTVECTKLSAFRLIKNAMVDALERDINDKNAGTRIRQIAKEILVEVLQSDTIDDLRKSADIWEID